MNKKLANIELLRVISMFMVVMIHLMTKTSVLTEMKLNQPVYYVSWFLYGLCMTGVNCYVIISGYFGVESKFRLEKLLRLYIQVLFYSIVIAVIAHALGLELVSGLTGMLLPITRSEYWFVTVYLGMYCIMPYLNFAAQKMDEKQLKQMLLVLAVLFSVIPTFLHSSGWLGDGGAYGIAWFSFLYFIGAYIRRFYNSREKKIGLYYLAAILIIPISKYIILFAGSHLNFVSSETIVKASEILYSFNSLPALCASVLLFVFFVNVKIENEILTKSINFIGRLTFGIYLIHNNRNISHYLWEKLRINYWLVERENILAVIGIWAAVFVVCAAVEWIRQLLFKLLGIDKLIGKTADVLALSRRGNI